MSRSTEDFDQDKTRIVHDPGARKRQDSIRIPEYDTQFIDHSRGSSRGSSSAGENLNYYQRIQQERRAANSGGSCQNPVQKNAAPDPVDYRNSDYQNGSAYDSYPDYEEEPGDDYDFGRSPKKKKHSSSGHRSDYDRYDGYRDDDRDYDRHRRKRHRKKRHPVVHFFVTLLVILLIIAAVIMILLHMIYSRLNRVDPVADTTADAATEAAGVNPYSESGVMNILLIGQDARTGEKQTRSDTMIIASLNIKTHQIDLTSLMRDMYVPIAGNGSNKLNAAYAFGGMETLDETVQEDFGIDINGNAVVDFDGFLSALTSVGDLDIELTQEEADYMNAHPDLGTSDDGTSNVESGWNLQAGMNSLTPSQALVYSRMRYVGNSDWDRTGRQRKVIQAAVSKMKRNPFSAISAMNQAAPSITTDMTDLSLTKALLFSLLCGSDMTTNIVPEEGSYYTDSIDGMAVLVPDLDACHSSLLKFIYNGGGTAADTGTDETGDTDDTAPAGNTDDGYSDNADAEDQNAGDGSGDDSGGSDDSGSDSDSDDYTYDERTGNMALDTDHDGVPDYWGDTW